MLQDSSLTTRKWNKKKDDVEEFLDKIESILISNLAENVRTSDFLSLIRELDQKPMRYQQNGRYWQLRGILADVTRFSYHERRLPPAELTVDSESEQYTALLRYVVLFQRVHHGALTCEKWMAIYQMDLLVAHDTLLALVPEQNRRQYISAYPRLYEVAPDAMKSLEPPIVPEPTRSFFRDRLHWRRRKSP